jgi:hypothetical protein
MEAYYSTREMADMIFCYGLANGSNREARARYVQKYPTRRVPSQKLFSKLFQRLAETGSLKPRVIDRGRTRSVRMPNMEERILRRVEEDPTTSVRRIAAAEGISHPLVWSILHEQSLYPYHIQRVQALRPPDYQARLVFCQWFLRKCVEDPHFIENILFTDEAGFTKNGIVNFHNTHVWSDENPHVIEEFRDQHQFRINVWAGIVGDRIIGPYVLPNRLTGAIYHQFLSNELPIMLEEIPLLQRQRMWFMHDGAPPHFLHIVRRHLTQAFNVQWIGRGGPVAWPARSPDLNPLDFWLWGHLKTLVYSTPVDDIQTLQDRIFNACRQISNQPGVFERVRDSLRRRIETCVRVNGNHIEQIL